MMATELKPSPHETHVRKIAQKAIGPAARIEVLEARLTCCTVILETLIELNKVDPAFHETMQRAIRHANEALAK